MHIRVVGKEYPVDFQNDGGLFYQKRDNELMSQKKNIFLWQKHTVPQSYIYVCVLGIKNV